MAKHSEQQHLLATEIFHALRKIYRAHLEKYPEAIVKDILVGTGAGVYAALTHGTKFPTSCDITMDLCKTILGTHDCAHEVIEDIQDKARFN